MKNSTHSLVQKLALTGLLTAVAVVGSLLSFPMFGSKCAPVQHMVNILAAVLLGPGWSVGIAFCASLLRNLMGLGTLMAFPGSILGALCCGFMYKFTRKLFITCTAEALGTGFLGGLCAYPVAKLLMGVQPASMFVYIIPFLVSTVVGSILAFLMLKILEKNGALKMMQAKMGCENH